MHRAIRRTIMHLAIGLLLFYAQALGELPVRRMHPLLFSLICFLFREYNLKNNLIRRHFEYFAQSIAQ
jgi:hypothetical protein